MNTTFEQCLRRSSRRSIATAFGLSLFCGTVALAQDANVPKISKLTLGASSAVGGSYDAYVRLLGRHIARHIPGSPTVVVQNLPAGGGMALANLIFNTAPKDGSYFGVLHGTTMQEELYKSSAVRFEARRFAWIGNMMSDVDTCVVSTASGIKSVEDFFTREVVMGATGAGAQSYSFPIVYNEILGTRLKVIAGYSGTPDRILAIERDELHGACGITTTSYRSVLEQPVKQGKVIMIVQAGGRKDPEFPDVPNMLDLAKTAEDRQAFSFLFSALDLGRPFAAPPETPGEQLAILRRAFDATMVDPEMLDEASRLKIRIAPSNDEATRKTIDRLLATPSPVVERIRTILERAAK
jgi:tripartite-type tricarboxylate transporter receptor subunit TctC